MNNEQFKSKSGMDMIGKSIVSIFLSIIVVGGITIYYSSKSDTSNKSDDVSSTKTSETELSDAQAKLSLSTSKSTYGVGEDFILFVYLDSNKSVDGVDVEILLDNTLVDISSELDAAIIEKQNLANFLNSKGDSIFSTFPFARVTDEEGVTRLSFSAISNPGKVIEGGGLVASIPLITKLAGGAKFELVFNGNGNSRDSNVAFLASDILKNVSGVSIEITN